MDLFQLALGLQHPWQVKQVEFAGEPAELHLHVIVASGVALVTANRKMELAHFW